MSASRQPESGSTALDDLLARILRAADQGQSIDEEQFKAENPQFAEELSSFFQNRRAIQQVARRVQGHELSTAGIDAHVSTSTRSLLGTFGDYELEAEIARGGMGVVYRARHKTLGRNVAVKMILAGPEASPADVARFRQEAEIAARLDHPHIVPVYEVGEHDGHRFYAMKLIDGKDLTSELDRLRGDPRAAVKLLEKVARAVHFAHQHGILHRDLKPGNVLIDKFGDPHITDFGLARLTDSENKMTRTGATLGTPGFIAPEQIRGEKLLTTAADIYSLGAILYACLTGQPPIRGVNIWDALQKVLKSESPSPRAENSKVDVELDTICRKALERDAGQRYESAAAFADDLSRWLRHEPIEARPPGALRRGIKWVRRHPAVTAIVAMVALVLISVSTSLLRERKANLRAERHLYRTQLALAERELLAGAMLNARRTLAECPQDQRGWEWAYLRKLSYVTPGHRFGPFPQPLIDGGFTPDGRWMFVVDSEKIVRTWDAATRQEVLPDETPIREFLAHISSPVSSDRSNVEADESEPPVARSPNGQWTVFSRPYGNPHLEIRHLDQRKGIRIPTDSGQTFAYIFSADSTKLAFFAASPNLDLDDLALHQALPGFAPLIAAAEKEQPYLLEARVVELASGKLIASFQGFNVREAQLRFSPDNKTLMAFGGQDGEDSTSIARSASGELILWDIETRSGSRQIAVDAGKIHDLKFSPDGERLVTAHEDHRVRIWRVRSASLERVLEGHNHPVRTLAFGNDSKTLLSADETSIVLWNCDTGQQLKTIDAGPEQPSWSITSAALHPDGKQIAVADQLSKRTIVIGTANRATIFAIDGNAQFLAYSPDGRWLAIPYQFDQHGAIKIVDAISGQIFHQLESERQMEVLRTGWGYLRVAFSADSRYLAAVGNIGGVHVFHVRRGARVANMTGHGTTVWDVDFTSDNQRIATGGYSDAMVKIWSRTGGEELHTFRGHEGHITGLQFSPDDSRLATTDSTGSIRIWEAW